MGAAHAGAAASGARAIQITEGAAARQEGGSTPEMAGVSESAAGTQARARHAADDQQPADGADASASTSTFLAGERRAAVSGSTSAAVRSGPASCKPALHYAG